MGCRFGSCVRVTRPEERATAEDLFRRAQRQYLTGNWVGSEQLLAELIRIDSQDIDAKLLLATLLRRTGQLTEASDQLRRLEATDGTEKWRSEIDRERKLLDELFHPDAEADESENQISKDNQLTDNQSTDEPTAENQAA